MHLAFDIVLICNGSIYVCRSSDSDRTKYSITGLYGRKWQVDVCSAKSRELLIGEREAD